MWDTLWINANIATMAKGPTPYGAIRDGAIATKDGRIVWIGKREDLSAAPEDLAQTQHDLGGAWITPGLIDCHTHLVFAGDRAREFEMRLLGASYEEIARAGGGIASTVSSTRAETKASLAKIAEARLIEMMDVGGVTTIEIKSGYGLTLDAERCMLQAARELQETNCIRVRTSFLGLHALPPEFSENRRGYIDHVCDQMLPTLAAEGLVDAVDAYCDTIGFAPAETDRLFASAKALGLPVKLHAEQLSNQHGAALAAQYEALSADHLEWLDEEGIAEMAVAGTIAVLLPGAFYVLRESRLPPIEALRAAGVPMAVATDCNPGTSPLVSPLLAMNMACTLFRLTPEEALAGMTRNAARALGLQSEIGTLEVGKAADLAIWNVREPAELSYWMGANLLRKRVFAGKTT
ncbi:MAG: imidazolonepropionase [Alphaproteobacteria bacterium]